LKDPASLPDATRHLQPYGLREWPFREVPEPSRCTFIAGRPELVALLEGMLSAPSGSVSAIFLFWASLGAGKTHALYYLLNRMRQRGGFLPIYTEYPEAPATFSELYQGLAQRIDWDALADSCLHLFVTDEPEAAAGLAEVRLTHPDIYRALFLLAEGEDVKGAKLARRWMRGEELAKADLRAASLSRALRTPADCAAAISVLARILALKHSNKPPLRLVWILDECQRLKLAPPRLNQEINAGLQSAFNSTPDHLTLILSFSGKPERSFPDWLRPELGDRIGARNVILLPPFTRQQARTFLRELLEHYRRSGDSLPPFFPFSEAAIEALIARLLKGDRTALGDIVEKDGIRPRALVKCCHAALQEHLHAGAAPPIDESFMARMLPQ